MKLKKLESVLAIVTKVATKFSVYSAAFMGTFGAMIALVIKKSYIVAKSCIVAKNK